MKKLIKKQFLLDDELDNIIGGESSFIPPPDDPGITLADQACQNQLATVGQDCGGGTIVVESRDCNTLGCPVFETDGC